MKLTTSIITLIITLILTITLCWEYDYMKEPIAKYAKCENVKILELCSHVIAGFKHEVIFRCYELATGTNNHSIRAEHNVVNTNRCNSLSHISVIQYTEQIYHHVVIKYIHAIVSDNYRLPKCTGSMIYVPDGYNDEYAKTLNEILM